MRRTLIQAALAVLAIAAAGCATTMTVSSHVESGLDVSHYRTYDWGPADALPTGDPRLDKSPFFQDHMQGAVEKALAGKGFERAASAGPDLLIHYHANIARRFDVNTVDRRYGYCSNNGCGTGVSEYEAGTLVLDIVDARTNRVIWRGWAQDSIERALGDPDRMAEQIDEAVSRMMVMFPGAR